MVEPFVNAILAYFICLYAIIYPVGRSSGIKMGKKQSDIYNLSLMRQGIEALTVIYWFWFLSAMGSMQMSDAVNSPIPITKQEQVDDKRLKMDLFTSVRASDPEPFDRIYFDEVWKLQSHPSVSIAVPRSPHPTFGMVLPLPKWWTSTIEFYPVDADRLKVRIYGTTNYILDSAIQRFETLLRTRTGLSVYSLRWLHQQSLLPKLARENLRMANSRNHLPGTGGADSFSAALPTGSWHTQAEARLRDRFGSHSHSEQLPGTNGHHTVAVKIKSSGASWPSLKMDESYILSVSRKGIFLYANETWGALHGLTSLIQLFWQVPGKAQVYVNHTLIQDAPRFPHRGLMVDSSRHFINKNILLLNLETMAFNKLNVFHWHLIDDQSYPYQSKKYPNLSKKGAYSNQHVYTVEDIREVVEFGRLRGIRIIPEFDVPGHTRSLAYSIPQVLAHCTDHSSPYTYFGPLNPFKNETYTFLNGLLSEALDLFRDEFIHLGGDEVEPGCWAADDAMTTAREQMNFHADSVVHEYFWRNLQNLFTRLWVREARKRRLVVWEDAIEHVTELHRDLLVQVWKSDLSVALQHNYEVIYSTCWYLDQLWDVRKWPSFYLCDPVNNPSNGPVLPLQHKKVLGGEACMWSEYQSDDTILQKIWPVTSAVAERLWSPAFVNNIEIFGPRIEEHRCRMSHRGVPVSVMNGPGFCPHPSVLSTLVQTSVRDSGILRDPTSGSSNIAQRDHFLSNQRRGCEGLFYIIIGILIGMLVSYLISLRLLPSKLNSGGFLRLKPTFGRTCLFFVVLLILCWSGYHGFCF